MNINKIYDSLNLIKKEMQFIENELEQHFLNTWKLKIVEVHKDFAMHVHLEPKESKTFNGIRYRAIPMEKEGFWQRQYCSGTVYSATCCPSIYKKKR